MPIVLGKKDTDATTKMPIGDLHGYTITVLWFGGTSQQLHKAVTEFTDWLTNRSPPWTVYYRALQAGRLMTLDKCPGVRPAGIGESWIMWIMLKWGVLLVTRGKAKEICDMNQLCVALESGIKGSIQAKQYRSLSVNH
jgi:hypothetical protein